MWSSPCLCCFIAVLISYISYRQKICIGTFFFKCEGVSLVKKLVTQMQELIPVIKKTLSLGIQPETKEFSKNGIDQYENEIIHFFQYEMKKKTTG